MEAHHGPGPELAHSPWKSDFERLTREQRESCDNCYQEKNDAFHKARLNVKNLAVWKGQRYRQDYLATIVVVDESVGEGPGLPGGERYE